MTRGLSVPKNSPVTLTDTEFGRATTGSCTTSTIGAAR